MLRVDNAITSEALRRISEGAALIRSILEGNCNDRAAIDLVLINAAVPIFLAGFANALPDAYELAKQSLTSGAALAKLRELAAATK